MKKIGIAVAAAIAVVAFIGVCLGAKHQIVICIGASILASALHREVKVEEERK